MHYIAARSTSAGKIAVFTVTKVLEYLLASFQNIVYFIVPLRIPLMRLTQFCLCWVLFYLVFKRWKTVDKNGLDINRMPSDLYEKLTKVFTTILFPFIANVLKSVIEKYIHWSI